MGCCCSSCKVPDIECSLDRPELKQKRLGRPDVSQPSGTPRAPAAPQMLGASRQSERPSAQQPPQSARRDSDVSLPTEQPPPYDSNAVQKDTRRSSVFGSRETLDPVQSSSSQPPRELPYVIPLTSAGAGTSSEESLAAAYAPDLQSLGVPPAQYMAFLAGLDTGLFASPTAQPGSVSAYIHSMFQDHDNASSSQVTWHTSTTAGSINRSQAYVSAKNAELFHGVSLHVEVLGTADMKRQIDTASEASLLKIKGDRKLDGIEAKRSKEALKLEQKLLTSKTLEKQQKAMRKFLEKDDKYNRKALKAISKAERRIDEDAQSSVSEEANDDGMYWLLVTRYEG
ncbi:hypothetical protein AMS68_008047 [Peltaster fructicola]|uniref:Uncharacterized protein n=1 Tax=Peltaster fructicola TaxID=286661 RepID=A0A6H0Y7F2_9PEZI|nr:hypothetical protein AMS68_008047 [Peltaster fructicola]